MYKSRLLVLIFIFLCSCSAIAQENHKEYSITQLLSRYNQQSVPYISVETLKRDLQEYVILDTRKEEEYNVSHLPGAIWVGEDYDEQNFPILNKNSKIVVYCSVGIRSESFGEELLDDGYTDVKNLYGSIFAWKDAGYLVFNLEQQATDRVHVYAEKWGKYLRSGIKVHD